MQYDASGDVTQDNRNQYLYDGEGLTCPQKTLPVYAVQTQLRHQQLQTAIFVFQRLQTLRFAYGPPDPDDERIRQLAQGPTGVDVNTRAAIQYPGGYTYCGDFICNPLGQQVGVANSQITGIHEDPTLIFAGAGAVGYVASDIGAVEAGQLFGTRFAGNRPLLNSGDSLRIGWSYIRTTGQYVFRIGGTWIGAIKSNPHINLWPPSWWFK